MSKRDSVTVLVIRHAESTANVEGRLAGRIDPTPLSSEGRSAAKALSEVFKVFNPQVVLSSPLLRCRQTANLAGAANVELDDRLIEMDYGKWSGKRLKNLATTDLWRRIQGKPDEVTFPGGESFKDAEIRIKELLADLNQRKVEKVALFTHGDISRILINHLLGRSLNEFQRILIETASHSMLSWSRYDKEKPSRVTLHYLNRRESVKKPSSKKFQVGGE